MVKFGIISDTHIDKLREKEIQSVLGELKSIFHDVDLIIHAGDMGSEKILKTLKNIGPVKYIGGECDEDVGLESFIIVPTKDFSKKIGIIHKLPENLEQFCKEKDLIGGILIYGHTHIPMIEGTDFNVLLLNPGSPTMPEAPAQKRGFDQPVARPSVMKLTLENGIVTTFIINLKYEL